MASATPVTYSSLPPTANTDATVVTVAAGHRLIITDWNAVNVLTSTYKYGMWLVTSGSTSANTYAYRKNRTLALGTPDGQIGVRLVLEAGTLLIVQATFASAIKFTFNGIDITL